MNTKKQNLTMRDFNNRYIESDLPSLVHAQNPTILRWLRASAPFLVSNVASSSLVRLQSSGLISLIP